jgi:hypothetical protein
MNRRVLYLLGLSAPFVFVLAAVLGGALRPGYSHVSDTLSELFSPGSPNRLLLSTLYTLFAVCLSSFGIGLLRFVRDREGARGIGTAAATAYFIVGVLNILTATLFPQDSWGSTPTLPGRLHLILHGAISLLSLLYIVLFGVWFHRTGIAKAFRTYSIATVVAAVIAGTWFMASYGTPLMGLSERAAALVGLQWTVVLAVIVLKSDRSRPLKPLTSGIA